jgi:alcohol dehydrogenase (NADP+)
MALVGLPGPSMLDATQLIDARRRLAGSSVGGIREMQEMLDFCAAHSIESDVEVISMKQVNEAFERTLRSDVRYRFVIDMATLGDTGEAAG